MYHNMYSFPSHILALNLLHKILFFHRNEDVSSIIVTQAQQELEETSVESARDKQPIYVEPGIRVVELNRLPDAGLGISIVGGKADSEGLGLKGIYIRHVLESSPAGRLGTLNSGDQILEVSHYQSLF